MADGSMDCNRPICDSMKYNRCYKSKLEKHSEVADFRQGITVHYSLIHNKLPIQCYIRSSGAVSVF